MKPNYTLAQFSATKTAPMGHMFTPDAPSASIGTIFKLLLSVIASRAISGTKNIIRKIDWHIVADGIMTIVLTVMCLFFVVISCIIFA